MAASSLGHTGLLARSLRRRLGLVDQMTEKCAARNSRQTAVFAFAAKAGAGYGIDFSAQEKPGETRPVVTLHPVRIAATRRG
jgi:hypothetical protein